LSAVSGLAHPRVFAKAMTGRRHHREARDYFRNHKSLPSSGSATFSHPMGEGLVEQLAHRAEAVFARHPFTDA